MSQILWCDPGGHAFSVNDPDRQSFAARRTKKDAGGNEIREELDICGPCHKSNALGVRTLTAPTDKPVKSVAGSAATEARDAQVCDCLTD